MTEILFIIGPPRSGTTLLGTIFSKVRGFGYIEEPNFIWRGANPFNDSDVYTESDFSESKANLIKKRLAMVADFDNESTSVVIEKTPANCLRLPFLKCIYPEAKFLFLYRDEVDIAHSMSKKWLQEDDANSVKLDGARFHRYNHFKKIFRRFFSLRVIEILAYIPRILSELLFLLNMKKRKYWGVRYKGWRADVRKGFTTEQLITKQIRECYSAIEDFKLSLNSTDYLDFCYNNIVSVERAVELENFLGIAGIDDEIESIRLRTIVK